MSAALVADYHLFKVESAIEFVSLSVQIVRWVREYQGKLFNGIMKDRPSPTTVSTVGTKRDHESDNEDPEGGIRSKRQNTKQTEAKTTAEPAELSHTNRPPTEQPKRGAEESSVWWMHQNQGTALLILLSLSIQIPATREAVIERLSFTWRYPQSSEH